MVIVWTILFFIFHACHGKSIWYAAVHAGPPGGAAARLSRQILQQTSVKSAVCGYMMAQNSSECSNFDSVFSDLCVS